MQTEIQPTILETGLEIEIDRRGTDCDTATSKRRQKDRKTGKQRDRHRETEKANG